jgi:RES domain-containing protein
MSGMMSARMSAGRGGREVAAAAHQGREALDPASLPVRTISGEFFRHTAPSRDARDVPRQALAAGRYHRKREEPPLYASSHERAAWGELFRHSEPEISPFEVRRRMTRLRVTDLPILDLTDPEIRRLLGVTEKNLVSNRYANCRRIADLARRAPRRFGGILAPSAADPEAATLVVFLEWVEPKVEVIDYSVRTPPMHLLALFQRVIETLPPRVQDPLRALADELVRQANRLRPSQRDRERR